MIPADAIDRALARLDNETEVERAMVAFATEQPAFLQYLRTEAFDLLSQDERDYLQYLVLVLAEAVRDHTGAVPALRAERLEHLDELCWGWMQDGVNKPMRERLDVFFEHIDEEEMLAFAEDSLVDPDRDDAADNSDGPREAQLFATGASRELGLVTLALYTAATYEALAEA